MASRAVARCVGLYTSSLLTCRHRRSQGKQGESQHLVLNGGGSSGQLMQPGERCGGRQRGQTEPASCNTAAMLPPAPVWALEPEPELGL
jgi:hypothetical protein